MWLTARENPVAPPVAMSAYYLKQVVPQWSLGTIYKGMFDFMLRVQRYTAKLEAYMMLMTDTYPKFEA